MQPQACSTSLLLGPCTSWTFKHSCFCSFRNAFKGLSQVSPEPRQTSCTSDVPPFDPAAPAFAANQLLMERDCLQSAFQVGAGPRHENMSHWATDSRCSAFVHLLGERAEGVARVLGQGMLHVSVASRLLAAAVLTRALIIGVHGAHQVSASGDQASKMSLLQDQLQDRFPTHAVWASNVVATQVLSRSTHFGLEGAAHTTPAPAAQPRQLLRQSRHTNPSPGTDTLGT